ncbi:hypothetical protein D3C84_955760 [compost metagenome]
MLALADAAQLPGRQVPHQGVRTVVDLWAQAVEAFVQVTGLVRFGAIQRDVGAGEPFGLAPVDLPAIATVFVEQDRLEARCDQGLRATDTRRSSAYNDYPRSGHIASGC